jgi:hypothetical protein
MLRFCRNATPQSTDVQRLNAGKPQGLSPITLQLPFQLPLAKAIAPKMLVPIHSFETKRFKEFFDNVEMKDDRQWWEVPHA